MYRVIFSPKAQKLLSKLPKDYQTKIRNITNSLIKNPFSLDIKKLSQRFDATHRLRVGSYRLLLFIDTTSKVIVIANIVRRTTQTYR